MAEQKYTEEKQTPKLQQQIIDGYISAHDSPRDFELFVGPTNSGKTHDALDRLSSAKSGVYLAPLRLLAAEVAFEMNESRGTPCSLLTGEEHRDVEGARHVSSTVEMLNMGCHYDVAVIDEAQMLGDDKRGGAWTRAILGVNADNVCVCCAPEAEGLVRNLIRIAGDRCVATHHLERLAGMEFDGEVEARDIKPHDAIVTFSARGVERTAEFIEAEFGYKCSRIYGSMPPEVRLKEEERFSSGKTDIVVATDAIGMGINLPVERVVFCETSKFDGSRVRDLTPTEIKQIAGRAGRFGVYDTGHYATFESPELIKGGYEAEPDMLGRAYLNIPRSMFEAGEYVSDVYRSFEEAIDVEGGIFASENVTEKAQLATVLEYDLWSGINTADVQGEFFEKAENEGYYSPYSYLGEWIEARGNISVEGLIDTRGMLSDTIRKFAEFPLNVRNEEAMNKWEALFLHEISGEPLGMSMREFCGMGEWGQEPSYMTKAWLESKVAVCDMISYYEQRFGTEKEYQEVRQCRNECIKELNERLDAQDEPKGRAEAQDTKRSGGAPSGTDEEEEGFEL